ncbi:toprim domain-containing protein [Micromonospora carbonacea]|uniref:hypothetical protein n=1 Tax=Micromonospora carbonacea TaxID=47853 RepID=UPI0037197AD4
MTAYEWFMGLLDAIGSGAANTHTEAGRRQRQCPAHADSGPSMSVRPGPDGTVRITCFTGCTRDQILAALRCSRSRLAKAAPVPPAQYAEMVGLRIDFPAVEHKRNGPPAARGFRLEAVHNYGRAVLERWRSGQHKELVWETVKPNGARVPGLFGVTLDDLPLYRETEVQMAVAVGEPVLLVESESSVDALRGWYATTWAGGASAVNIGRIAQVLGGYPNTIVIPDNDRAGLACLARLNAAGLAPHVLMPGADEDARDLHRRLGPAGFEQAVHRLLAECTTRQAA